MTNTQDRLIGVREICEIFGVGKDTATSWLNEKSCPTLPRRKGAPYLVSESALRAWIQKGGKA